MTFIVSSTFLCTVLPVEAGTTRLRIQASKPHTNHWHLSHLVFLCIYFPFHVFMAFLPVHSFIQALSHLISGHAFSSGKCLLLLSSGGVSPPLSSLSLHHYWAGSHPHLFHPEFIKDTVIDSIHTVQTQAQLCRILCPQRLDEQGGRTDRHQVPVQEGGSESRRERSWAAHLVADGLVLEPRLVQDLLQLLVVEVGHPDGLG